MRNPNIIRGRLSWSVPLQPETQTTNDADFISAYNCIRVYIEEENRLVAERISRTLLVHGFLIASFVLLIQAKAQAIAQAATALAPDGAFVRLNQVFSLADWTLPLIAWMGVFTSLAALVGVFGATLAIGSLKERVKTLADKHPEQWSRLALPLITGGGRPFAAIMGWTAAYGLLLLLAGFWLVITAASVPAWSRMLAW